MSRDGFLLRVAVLEAKHLAWHNTELCVRVKVGEQRRKITNSSKNNDSPYFNESFVFEFTSTLEELEDLCIELAVLQGNRYTPRSKVLCSRRIDVATVWKQPGHAFHRKWLELIDSTDIEAGAKGHLKVDLAVLARGEKAQTPAPSAGEDEDDVAKHLLTACATPATRCKLRYLVRVYRAQLVAPWGERKAGTTHAYVKATFAGAEGRTRVCPTTTAPEWNQQIEFTDLFPSLCQRIKLEVRNNADRTTIAAHTLDVSAVSCPGDGGFAPTFGPCHVPLYATADADAYRGWLLVAVATEAGGAGSGTSDADVQVTRVDPPARKELPKNESFLLFGAIFSAFLLHPKTATKKLHFEITWADDGDMTLDDDDDSDDYDDDDDEGTARSPSRTAPKMSRLAWWYAYLDVGSDKPCVSLRAKVPDCTRRMHNAAWLAQIAHSLDAQLRDWRTAQDEGFADGVASLCSLLDALADEWRAYLAWTWQRHAHVRATPLDRERAKLAGDVTRHFGATSRALKRSPNAVTADACWERARRGVLMLETLAADPQPALPDVFVWLKEGARRVAVCRVPAADLLHAERVETRGRLAGRLQTLLLRATTPLDAADVPAFGVLDMALWLGVDRPPGQYLAALPTGWSLAGQSAPTPRFLRYPPAPPLRLRVHVQRAQLPPGADSSALADPSVRVAMPGTTRATRVVAQSLVPVWDETLVFDDVVPHHAPTVALVVVDQDRSTSLLGPRHYFEFMGLALLRVEPTLTSTALQSVALWHGADRAGELLVAVEVLESDATPGDTLPAHLRLRTVRYRLDVYFWGLRDMARLRALPVANAQVTLRIGDVQLTSSRLKTGALNFSEPVASVELDLPEDERRLPPVTIAVVDWRLGRAVDVGSHTLRSAATLLFPLLTPAEFDGRRRNCALEPSPSPLPEPCATVFGVVGGPQLPEDTREEDYAALVESCAKHKRPCLENAAEPLFPVTAQDFYRCDEDNSDEDEGRSLWCCRRRKPKEGVQDAPSKDGDAMDDKDTDDKLDWWTKYHASRLAAHDALITLYPNELEEQPEFAGFHDWLRTFPVQRGKLERGEDAERLRVGAFKGCTRLYRWPSERRVTPWGFDVGDDRDSLARLPRNGPAELVVRLYVVKATGLHPKDASGKADPFLQVLLGGRVRADDAARAVPCTLEPVFGRCVEMSAALPADAVLTVRVMDHDQFSSADLMGETIIDLEDRFWSEHRATCGLPSRFDEIGFNRWRDSSRPRQILADLCRRTRTCGPLFAPGSVTVGDVVVRNAAHGVLAPEGADNELAREQLALDALRRWREVSLTGVALVPEHVEARSLYSPQCPGIEQGKLHLWVDLFPAGEALGMQPPVDITPRSAEGFELRLVLWNMEEVPLTESDLVSGKQKTDIYVKAWMVGSDDEQVSDVHYNSLTGEGNFNWRFVFPFNYLSSERCMVVKRSRLGLASVERQQPCKLFLQVWDNDIVTKDDFIGALTLELSKMPRCVAAAGDCTLKQLEASKFNLFRQKRARGWWPFTRIDEDGARDFAGKMEAEIRLVTAEEAAKNPVGLGRKEPEALPMPVRPESSLRRFMNPLRALQMLVCRGCKMPLCIVLAIVLVVLFVAYYVYCLPDALARRTVGIL